ncbi:hypothetical protein [Streptomyces sp. NRRL F-5123]|uniref:hypothetical protein n=1 Tax=Streptomyces sp. NRRL F-5123 TaxID=1463856 RepID=UPI0004E204F3|nr:hypothetical protein [Streptomyces sp. NRRL F-5123]
MTDTTWHADLTASVHALGAAARELRAAHTAAVHAARAVDPTRLVPLPGLLAVPGTTEPVRPYDEALRHLTHLYAAAEQRTHELYANAALGYAHGAAQALAAVLRAERPHHVDLPRDTAGRYVLADLPDLAASLTTTAGARELAALHTRLRTATDAERPDAATAYGEQAERSLHHLIRHAAAHGFLHTH